MRVTLKKILVATDGSTDATLAARAAVDLSTRSGSRLHIVHTWHSMPSPRFESFIRSQLREAAEELLAKEVARIEGASGDVAEAHLKEGRPADEVATLAGELEADLVVVGSRGLGAVKRLVMGSVSEGIIHLASCPVLVMRGGEGAWPPDNVIIGDDSSEDAKRAGELAAGLGQLFGASTLLVRAYSLPRAKSASTRVAAIRMEDAELKRDKEALEERAGELENVLGRRPQVRVVAGDAAAVIQKLAEEGEKPALVAVGSRGLGASRRLVLGSVSTDTLRAVSGPVLIVPPPKG